MSDRHSDDNGLAGMLGKLAQKQAEEAEAWQREDHRDDRSELRPIDDLERARMTEALFGVQKKTRALPRWLPIAAVFLLVALPASLVMLRGGNEGAATPRFQMIVASGAATVRSSTAADDRYSKGSRFELVFQPETRAEEAPEISVARIDPADPAKAPQTIEVPIERSEGGAFRIKAEIGRELSFPPGPQLLRISVGRKNAVQQFHYRFVISDLER